MSVFASPSPQPPASWHPRRRVPDRTAATRSAGTETEGSGGDCTRTAAGDGRGRVCGGVCGEAVIHGVPEL